MLIPNQKIKLQWKNLNKKYYQDLGYVFTNRNDEFFVKPEDLPKHSKIKVGFICDYCKETFYVSLKNYNRWERPYFGEYKCAKCYQKMTNNYSQETRTENIYEKVMYICNKYGYELLTPKSDMINVNCMIDYVCPKHGKQSRRAHLFVFGNHICPECNKENKRLSIEYVSKVIRDKGSLLINPQDYKGTQISNLRVMCSNCWEPFVTSYNSFICTRDGDGQFCPNCIQNRSKGEIKIKNFLEKMNIDYISQYTFEDCKDSKKLPFDFYIPNYRLVIEFDGKQHFEPTSFCSWIDANDNYKYVKKHDMIKNLYCFSHGISIIRIPYYDYEKVEEKLEYYFNSHDDIV